MTIFTEITETTIVRHMDITVQCENGHTRKTQAIAYVDHKCWQCVTSMQSVTPGNTVSTNEKYLKELLEIIVPDTEVVLNDV